MRLHKEWVDGFLYWVVCSKFGYYWNDGKVHSVRMTTLETYQNGKYGVWSDENSAKELMIRVAGRGEAEAAWRDADCNYVE